MSQPLAAPLHGAERTGSDARCLCASAAALPLFAPSPQLPVLVPMSAAIEDLVFRDAGRRSGAASEKRSAAHLCHVRFGVEPPDAASADPPVVPEDSDRGLAAIDADPALI